MIGVFDSGVGGLTVVRELFARLPDRPVVYFGDTARTPYGNKSSDTIIRYACEDTEFLLNHGATVIVIGCNTASAEAADELRRRYPGVPIFEVIRPAVAAAVTATRTKRIGVIGTRGTIASGIYQRLLGERDSAITVAQQACPLFVPLVEENWVSRPETKMVARRYLQPLQQAQVDTVILGCTHYPLLKEVISARLGKSVRLVDPAVEVVGELERQGVNGSSAAARDSRFFVSDLTPHVQTIANRWLGRSVQLEVARVG